MSTRARSWCVPFACAALAGLVACGGGGSGGGGGGSSGGAEVTIVTSSLAGGTTGLAYGAQIVATFPHPPGSYFVSGGTLPPGLELDGASGAISGYPRQVGTFVFDVSARDGADLTLPPGRDASYPQSVRRFSMAVARGLPNFLPKVPPAAQYRATYSFTFDVAGGTTPMSFALAGGTLPTGVSLSSSGAITGFPTQTQPTPYAFDVRVTDAAGLSDVESFEIDVRVKPLLMLSSGAIAPAALAFPYSHVLQLASTGGGEPFTWSQVPPVSGETDLASIGLHVTSDGRVADLGGGPTALGTFLFTVRVTDEPGQVATRQLSLTVNPGPTLASISPRNGTTVGTFTATGLNFQQGAVLIVKPGPTQTQITPTFVSPTTLTFSSPVPKPVNGNGAQPVMVRNPDGGEFTLAGGLVFPASTIAFGAKGFLASSLSSTGLDVADVDGDGFADLVHSGTSGQNYVYNTTASTAAGLIFHRNLATSPVPTFGTTLLDSGSYSDVKFADVNVDGKLDVVALGTTTLRVWIGAGDGTFSAGPTSTLNGPGAPQFPSELTVGKLNGDQIPDVAFGVCHFSWMGFSNVNGRAYTMAGTGTGSFVNLDQAVTTISNTYGCVSMVAIDANGDGRHEIAAGRGLNVGSGPPFTYNQLTSGTGLFGTWMTRGPTIAAPAYNSTTGMAAGDFLGNGTQQLVTITSGSPNYSNSQVMMLHSGSDLGTNVTLTTPGSCGKSMTAVDADFDSRMDFAVSILDSRIVVYKGATLAIATTLDAAAGVPSISSPRVGRLASGDVNGDGAPDLLGTTSTWSVNGMAANHGTTYTMNTNGNGGSMGIVFFLNASN
jgi:hypothetical protein